MSLHKHPSYFGKYKSEIWNPSTKGLITTKFGPYEERLKELNLSSLEDLRKSKDNILLFKGLHGMSFISLQDGVNFHDTKSISLRSSDSLTIISKKCNTNIFKQTFFNCVLTLRDFSILLYF